MNFNFEIDIEGIVAAAVAPERIQPLLDKAITDAMKQSLDEATGYRSEFRKLLTQQLTEAPFWKSGFVGEPAEVFRRDVVNRHAVRRKMQRPVFAEGHAGAPNLLQIGAHAFGEVVHGFRVACASRNSAAVVSQSMQASVMDWPRTS